MMSILLQRPFSGSGQILLPNKSFFNEMIDAIRDTGTGERRLRRDHVINRAPNEKLEEFWQ